MADYHWPPTGKRSLIGKRISRIDGPWKASGRAKYSFDVNRPGMLYGKMLFSPYAHAVVVKLDTTEAEKMPGVKAIHKFIEGGTDTDVKWQGQEIVAVAAETEEQARDAVNKIHVEFAPLSYLVADTDPEKAGKEYTQASAEQTTGDPAKGFQEASVTIEGHYGSRVITHCCLESHGQVTEWQGDSLNVWASTQNLTGIAGEYSKALNIGANKVHIVTPVMGGGFGSKFPADSWGIACAQLAKKAGRPVKMMLERDQELLAAGCRPSLHARVKVGAKNDGTLTAWESRSWGTGGVIDAGAPNLPYVFRVPNRSSQHTIVHTNIGPARAWRAPNHPQMCLITMAALDDLAAKLKMDPLDFFQKNISITGDRAPNYAEELVKASEIMEWKKKWHPRGDTTPGPVKRGLGVSIHTWGGRGHQSNCNALIHSDGSVEVSLASQDLGTGTRTVIGIVAAESFGLPLSAVKVNIGDSHYPPSGPSGGSTTVGGVSSSTRRASIDALNQLFEKVAPSLGAKPEQLEAVDGKVRVTGSPAKSMTWKQACAKIGTTPITGTGKTSPDLISSSVGGVQMADVTVDTETGIVHMNKIVAVQDCGLIIDAKTAESQVFGACIMGVTYSLFEEKIMDDLTGKCLNPNMEFYKLAGIADVGEIVVHMMTGPGYDDRGVIGLGEPPTVSPGAAISNAVANAIGVRVPELPITPERVLAALEAKGGAA
ncbi:MAG: xanthine dehydrogenase family protein molybdopterin-binding subunit [Candidatus Acidiferrales bacterium]